MVRPLRTLLCVIPKKHPASPSIPGLKYFQEYLKFLNNWNSSLWSGQKRIHILYFEINILKFKYSAYPIHISNYLLTIYLYILHIYVYYISNIYRNSINILSISLIYYDLFTYTFICMYCTYVSIFISLTHDCTYFYLALCLPLYFIYFNLYTYLTSIYPFYSPFYLI